MHNTPVEWQMARVAYEWAQGFQFHRASLGERLKFLTNTAEDPLDLDKKVLLTDKVHDTWFPVRRRSWSYPEDDDDGELAEHQ